MILKYVNPWSISLHFCYISNHLNVHTNCCLPRGPLAKLVNITLVTIRFIYRKYYNILDITIGGWWLQPLWKIWKSVGMIIPNIGNKKKCSKLPTSTITIVNGFLFFKSTSIHHWGWCPVTSSGPIRGASFSASQTSSSYSYGHGY